MITLGAGLHRDIPMETYHGNCAPGPSVSASVLFELAEACPARALAKHYLSPWPREDDDTPATSLGTAAHTLILEGDDVFAERYAVKPEDMSFSTTEGKAWKAEHGHKEIIKAADFAVIKDMRRAIDEHPAARNAFTGGQSEVTAIWQDPETGIWLKARPDYLRKGLAINFKTTASAAEYPWSRDAIKFGYHVSAAVCVDVLRALDHPAHYCFVAQEKVVPHLVSVRVLADDFMEAGRMIYRRALRQFADCIATAKWPGYGDEAETMPLPAWLDRKLANIESPL